MMIRFLLLSLFMSIHLTGCLLGTEDISSSVSPAQKYSEQATGISHDSGPTIPPLIIGNPALQSEIQDSSITIPTPVNDEETVAPAPVLDSVTLADIQVLKGEDQNPPEEEGVTLDHPEPEFDFPVVENDKVRYYIDYFSGDAKRTFSLWLERSGRYLPMMQEVFAAAGLPRDLAYLAMVESGFNDKAYSWAHAVGPWQFIESTGKRYGLNNDWWYDERRDPAKATKAAARFLSDLYDQFDGNWYLAIASYNAGPGKIRRAIRKYNSDDFWKISRGSYLRKETKNYVPKLLAAILIAKQPEKYGFTELDYQEPLEYDTTTLTSSTDIDVVAGLLAVEYDQIKRLNPELKRWCTPPGVKRYELRIPAGSKSEFEEKYAVLPPEKRANYVRHKVRTGDTLLALSNRYGVRVNDITRLNRIRNPRALQIGTNLIIPLNPDHNGRAVAELKDDYKRSRKRTYTVRSGDSLWSISRKFDVTQHQLRVWNRLGWSNVIRPGQRLIVSSREVPARQTAKAVRSHGPLKKVVYQVQPGDTLWGIGRQFAVETHEIRDWNNLSHNHVLMPGERLTLMVRGET